jgi:DNA-binding response OmpR family regulator
MIKKLRKFTNMTILCVMDDIALTTSLKEQLDDCKTLICYKDSGQSLDDIVFDILLIDYDYKTFLDIMSELKILKPLLPKIVLLREQKEESIVDCINSGAYSILSSPLDIGDLKLSIIMALNQSKRADKICLDNDIYYDSYRERFYNNSGAIPFTKFEFQVLKLLLDNSNKVINYDEIKEKVWKEKKMSIFTMRNVINKIRNKTYYNIIRNNSSTGYQIDTIK